GSVVKFEDRRGCGDGMESAPTLPYDGDGADAATESGEYLTVDNRPENNNKNRDETIEEAPPTREDERTLKYRGWRRSAPLPTRQRSTLPSPYGAPSPAARPTMHPHGSSAVPPPPSSAPPTLRNGEQCITGRYLPIQARALQHLARLKK